MANFVDRWLEWVTTRYRYAVPATLLLLGLLVIGYAGSFLLEWYELGNAIPAGANGEIKPPPADANVGVPAERIGEATDQHPGRNVRLRRSFLLAGGGVLLVIGCMSIGYGALWFRLARVKRLEDDDPLSRLN